MRDSGSREGTAKNSAIFFAAASIILVDRQESAQVPQSCPGIPHPSAETPRLGQIKGGESTQAIGASFWLDGRNLATARE
jgi:hypothetical protein